MIKRDLTFRMDNFMLIFWLSHMMLNVVPHFINVLFGGIFNLLLYWLFMFYFVFFYGQNVTVSNSDKNIKNTNGALLCFAIFSIIYMFLFQFLLTEKETYEAYGINFATTVWNMFSFIPSTISSVMIIAKSDNSNSRCLRRCIIIFSLIIFAVSSVYLKDNYAAVKITATGEGDYIPFLIEYSTVSAFSLAIPFLIYYVGITKHKLLYLMYLAIIIWGIIASSFFISILTVIVGVVCYFLLSIKNKWIGTISIVLVVGSIIYILISGLYISLISSIAENIPFEEVSKRLTQILLYTSSGKVGDTTTRISLYLDSIKAIIKHPVTGNIIWDSECFISGHSTFLDVWNGCGFIPLLFLVLFLKKVFKMSKSICNDNRSHAALVSSAIALAFVSCVNPIFASSFIMVLWIIAPTVFCMDLKRNSGEDNDNCRDQYGLYGKYR